MNPRPEAPASVLDVTEFARAAGVLALAGGSIGLGLEQLRGRWVA